MRAMCCGSASSSRSFSLRVDPRFGQVPPFRPLADPELIRQAVQVDRTIKGRAKGDAWDALERLVSHLAGAPKFSSAA